MRTIKTIIVDDERLAREELKSLLKQHTFIEVIAEAKNGIEAIGLIEEHQPDLLFLDVNMPGMTGFELLKQLEIIPMTIFVTAYDEFAVKAFEVQALDYILKPIEPQRLEEGVFKVLKKFGENLEDNEEEVEPLELKELGNDDSILIKDGERMWFIELSKVRLFESEGNYVKVHFDQNHPMILRSLGSVEERLDKQVFFRANRKFIINIKWIQSIENWFNGGLLVELKSGEKIEISRRQATRFKEMWSI
jgi:two-component system, LytTR family, response regulator